MPNAADIRLAVQRPAHIPPELVFDFDLYHDAGLAQDPHARILDLVRSTGPVFWTPRSGGFWVLRSHQAVYKASRDWETFTSEQIPYETRKALNAGLPEGAPQIPNLVPIFVDPPLHTMFRGPLQAAFSPKSAIAMRSKVRDLAVELIDAVKPDGHCEFMHQVAEPLPVRVFLDMLGMASANYPEYRALAVEQLKSSGSTPKESLRFLQRIAAAMRPSFLERQQTPGDDIISLLWRTEFEGQPATIEDLENYGVLLFIAGLDTVMNAMGFGVRHLAMHPELQRELRANPGLIPEAAEELLRRYTFTTPLRLVKRDTEFEGVTMKAEDRVMLLLAGADLDANEFPAPDEFDLNRENNVHIAFGVGPHRCLGSHLARVELQILYEEILARWPEFHLDPKRPPTFHGGNVIGIDALPLVWDR